MKRRYRAFGVALALLPCACTDTATPAPAGYPQSYARQILAARQEGSLTIWSVTDSDRVAGLLAGFQRNYPDIKVNYVRLQAQDLYQRFVADANARRVTADFLWSSAMDLQIKLVNDGYSQAYVSPERANLPDWALWKNEAWGITAEPIVFAYNRKFMSQFPKVPSTHPELVRFLKEHNQELQGKVATYDPAASAVGYLYLAEDKQANYNTWDLASALGQSGSKLYPRTEDILNRLADQRLGFAYDMIGSYALQDQARNPDLGVIVPRDYTLIMSRIAMIPRDAPHPNAARLFLDYLLSRAGQSYLSAEYMTSVRSDLPAPAKLAASPESPRAIRVGPALLVHQDQLTRRKFLRDWARAFARK